MEKALNAPIQFLKGIGPKKARSLKKIGIETVEDLLYYFPRRYEDRTNLVSISQLEEGPAQTIRAQVLARGERRSFKRRGFAITEAVVADKTGKVTCVWFNQPYLKDYFKVGTDLILSGKVGHYGSKLQMNSPEFEIVEPSREGGLDINRLVPVYSLPENTTQRYFRKIVKSALDECLPSLKDFLPYDIRMRNNLLNLAKSLINIHFPEDSHSRIEAYERLSFEEFLLFQVPLALRKMERKDKLGIAHKTEGALAEDFMNLLPFELTEAQRHVLSEIKSDMASPLPMQRLLQGDVGSGKTVVAVIASLWAIQGGYQAAFMVPTEILARQHFDKVSSQLSVLSCQQKQIKVALLTSSADKKEKNRVYKEIKSGEIDLVIGTHALLVETVGFKNLGLTVIDEQHKFGVGQRALLPGKGPNPDVLIMTATPIPRTLAITLYGDLDVSTINELPPGRLPVKTVNFSKDEKRKAYDIAKRELAQGRQVYIIYPVIEESYALDIAGAKKMHARLSDNEFRGFRLGLIYGSMPEKEQEETMGKFRDRQIDVLIATTVLEVGIDVPSASCMIIEHAERFGLAQLHQLRGRVGRGSAQSFCVLVSEAQTEEAGARIGAMIRYSDGFRIAEEDLKIRGPGEFFGKRQHGLTELKIANPVTQMQLLKKCREEAIKLVKEDRFLETSQNLALKEKLLQRFPEYEKLVVVG